MKVADLIRILQAFPPELTVVVAVNEECQWGVVRQVRSEKETDGEEIVLLSDKRL